MSECDSHSNCSYQPDLQNQDPNSSCCHSHASDHGGSDHCEEVSSQHENNNGNLNNEMSKCDVMVVGDDCSHLQSPQPRQAKLKKGMTMVGKKGAKGSPKKKVQSAMMTKDAIKKAKKEEAEKK